MRCRLLVTSCRAPSVVCASEMPSFALRTAWFRPLICVVMRLEIARPAASSFALLMRRPEDRRCSEVASALLEVVRLRWAFSDITFVLMTSAILDAPVEFLGPGLPAWGRRLPWWAIASQCALREG